MKTAHSSLALLCIFIFGITDVFGALPRDYQVWPNREDEFAKLPRYCTVKLGKNVSGAEYKSWSSSLGRDFDHMHHYCAGLNVMNYYYRTTGTADKQKVLKEAINQFSYMVDKAKPTWIMMPEIYANRGEVYILAGKFGEGLSDLNKALSLNPHLLKPYIALADHYTRYKQTKNAMEIISEGLRQNPESNALKRRYLELGGKEPFPEPYAKTEISEKPLAGKQEVTTAKQSVDADATTTNTQVPPVSGPETKQSQSPAIGVPGNPYCRFCPDPAPAGNPADHPANPSRP